MIILTGPHLSLLICMNLQKCVHHCDKIVQTLAYYPSKWLFCYLYNVITLQLYHHHQQQQCFGNFITIMNKSLFKNDLKKDTYIG